MQGTFGGLTLGPLSTHLSGLALVNCSIGPASGIWAPSVGLAHFGLQCTCASDSRAGPQPSVMPLPGQHCGHCFNCGILLYPLEPWKHAWSCQCRQGTIILEAASCRVKLMAHLSLVVLSTPMGSSFSGILAKIFHISCHLRTLCWKCQGLNLRPCASHRVSALLLFPSASIYLLFIYLSHLYPTFLHVNFGAQDGKHKTYPTNNLSNKINTINTDTN